MVDPLLKNESHDPESVLKVGSVHIGIHEGEGHGVVKLFGL